MSGFRVADDASRRACISAGRPAFGQHATNDALYGLSRQLVRCPVFKSEPNQRECYALLGQVTRRAVFPWSF